MNFTKDISLDLLERKKYTQYDKSKTGVRNFTSFRVLYRQWVIMESLVLTPLCKFSHCIIRSKDLFSPVLLLRELFWPTAFGKGLDIWENWGTNNEIKVMLAL